MLDRLSSKLADVLRQVSGKAAISEKNIRDALEEIKIALLEADVNLRVVRRFINRASEEALGEKVLRSVTPGQQFVKIVYDRMVALLGDTRQSLALKGPDTLSTILLLGLQGSGKTTTAAKLALSLRKSGRRPLLVAADRVRPAAVEQLRVLGSQAEVEVYTGAEEGIAPDSRDPIPVVEGARRHAVKNLFDVMIVDTSGRLQIDEALMAEVKRVREVTDPVDVLLVTDAMTGQNAVDIAKAFNEQVGITGVVLTKFDSDTRGGAAISIKEITGAPIKYVGVSEKLDGLEPFHPERIASRILGMGDVVTLVEKAQETIAVEEAEELRDKLESDTFTLGDYLEQFRRVRKMGSLESLMEMIPGLKGQVGPEELDEKEMVREEAIIQSMTLAERSNHRIISPSRRRRIAAGSGTAVYDVNRLLKRFEKARVMMKKMSKSARYLEQIMQKLGQGSRQGGKS
jgi:signal recognition particle subunit SRP54